MTPKSNSLGWSTVKFILLILGSVILAITIILWRIDNQRVERLRMDIIDSTVPNFSFLLNPITNFGKVVTDFRAYNRVYKQNQELKNELQKMQGWREAALQLEQANAKLRALNNLKLNPSLVFLTGEVLADVGGPFNQSALINVGALDGIKEGAAVLDGLGLVGRIATLGKETSRIIFLTDSNFSIPVTILPIRAKAIMRGNNSLFPELSFFDSEAKIQPGYRVVTSGSDGYFVPDLLIGSVIESESNFLINLAADFANIEFLRVLRTSKNKTIDDGVDLLKENTE